MHISTAANSRLCAFLRPDGLQSAASSQATAGTRHLCALYNTPPSNSDNAPSDLDDASLFVVIPTVFFIILFVLVVRLCVEAYLARPQRSRRRLCHRTAGGRFQPQRMCARCAVQDQILPPYTNEVLPAYTVVEEEQGMLRDSDRPSYGTLAAGAVEQRGNAQEGEQV